MNKKLFLLITLIISTSMILSACGAPAPVTEAPAQPAATEAGAAVPAATEAPAATTEPPTPTPVPVAQCEGGKTCVYWYIGLGAGAKAEAIPLEQAFVDKFNASQSEIQLIAVIVDNKYAADNLTAQLAAGNAPDIVGPVGTEGRASFPGAWLDLEPLVEKFKYDTSDIDPAFMDFYKVEGKLEGLPFAIYPSAVFYNKDLFDQAGLAYPPQKVGEKYTLDGQQVDWDFDTVAKVAQRLTLDKNGKDSTEADFDKDNIVQWGFDFQWVRDNPRWNTAYFGAYYPVKDGKADISADMIAGMKWYYDAQFGNNPFEPSIAALNGTLLNGNAFSSGKIGMAVTHLWYTCCIEPKTVPNWDAGVVPSYNGKITSKMHGDTFAIMAASKHPEEAFKVYTYMLGEGSADLYTIYGGLPARTSQQDAFFSSLDEKFAPNKVNWQVFLDMIPYLDAPNHQLGLPNNNKSNTAWNTLGSDLQTNPDLNVDTRVAEFITEWNAILAEKP